MSLFDFIFPEQAQAMHLRALREQNRNSSTRNSYEDTQNTDEIRYLKSENNDLRNDVGTLTLTVASLVRAIEKKGLLTNDEIKEMINQVDLMDAIKDGQLDVRFIRDLHK